MTVSAVSPRRIAFCRARSLPGRDQGPVLFLALTRFAVICFMDGIRFLQVH